MNKFKNDKRENQDTVMGTWTKDSRSKGPSLGLRRE